MPVHQAGSRVSSFVTVAEATALPRRAPRCTMQLRTVTCRSRADWLTRQTTDGLGQVLIALLGVGAKLAAVNSSPDTDRKSVV